MPQTLKSSGENTNQLKYIKTLQFWWLKTPIILLGKLFEHSGDICWDLCYNETIEFFESNLIWILRWQWHCIILWECFWISLMPKLFHLFTTKNNSSLHWQCICIIFGDNVLGSLYCQKTLISLMPKLFHLFIAKNNLNSPMTMYLDFKDTIVFASFLEIKHYHLFIAKKHWYLWWQCILVSWMPMHLNLFIANVRAALWCQRWFSSWDSSFRSLHWQSMCCILECVYSSLWFCDVHEVMTTFLRLFWRLCEKRIWRKEKNFFDFFQFSLFEIFLCFSSDFFSKKFWEKKSKREKEKN